MRRLALAALTVFVIAVISCGCAIEHNGCNGWLARIRDLCEGYSFSLAVTENQNSDATVISITGSRISVQAELFDESDKPCYIVSIEKQKGGFVESEISAAVEIVNVFSKKQYSLGEINDFLTGDKHITDGCGDSAEDGVDKLLVGAFDGEQCYTADYYEYTDGRVVMSLYGVLANTWKSAE